MADSERPCAGRASRSGPFVLAARGEATRRSSWALRATTIVDRLIRTAPTAGGSVMPAQARAPAASGMATML